jgi:hypothetical protein
MGKEFIPTLIQTTTYEPYWWLYLGEELNDEFHKLAKKKDIESIYNAIKNWSREFKEREQDVKERICFFLNDVGRAHGVVAVSDRLYQEVILAILYTFSE